MALRIRQDSDKDLSDKEILERYNRSGDLDILAALYKRYMPLVYGVCLKYLKNRDDSQDAVMEIFEKLISEVAKHKVENFKSWLYVLTKNYCLMQLRSLSSEKKQLKIIQAESNSFMENGEELHPLDKDSISDKALEDCISKLKAEQMKCIRLFYYENRCYREISEMLKLDEKKVKSYLQNAKRNLKICLESGNE